MPELSVLDEDLLAFQVPAAILQRRQVLRGAKQVDQVLVQWSGFPSSLATWEDEIALKSRFPRALAWGQAQSKGGGNVTGTPRPESKTSSPAQLGRPKRKAKPNPRVSGNDWVQ